MGGGRVARRWRADAIFHEVARLRSAERSIGLLRRGHYSARADAGQATVSRTSGAEAPYGKKRYSKVQIPWLLRKVR